MASIFDTVAFELLWFWNRATRKSKTWHLECGCTDACVPSWTFCPSLL